MAKLALLGGAKTVRLVAPAWPRVEEPEVSAVASAMQAARKDPSWLTSADGKGVVAQFESRFAKRMRVRHAMTTSGCGPALHVALLAAGVQPGDEVICPTYSWGQTAACVLQANAVPVFADMDADSYTLTAKTIAAQITRRTRAIVVVHIFGHAVDMEPIMKLARKRGIPVIEDNAQATGALYQGKRTGTLADIGCFSIGSGKQISGGEGGVLVTDDARLFERAVLFGQHPARHLRQVRDPELLAQSDSLIYTYRMHPMAAVICGAMLPRLDKLNAERRRNYHLLARGLKGVPGIRPVVTAAYARHVFHRYSPSFVPKEVAGVSREVYVRALSAEGVPISLGYVRTPIHLRRTFREKKDLFSGGLPWSLSAHGRKRRYRAGDCPNAEYRCAQTELTLGDGPRWVGDQRVLVKQILSAFYKVSENLDTLRGLTDLPKLGRRSLDALH
jgi:perosamine synthetase